MQTHGTMYILNQMIPGVNYGKISHITVKIVYNKF